MLFLLQEGFFEFVKGDAVEGEVFRALAEAGDAALVARHVFGCELCEGVEFAITFDFVVFCYCEFCSGRGVDDLVALRKNTPLHLPSWWNNPLTPSQSLATSHSEATG